MMYSNKYWKLPDIPIPVFKTEIETEFICVYTHQLVDRKPPRKPYVGLAKIY